MRFYKLSVLSQITCVFSPSMASKGPCRGPLSRVNNFSGGSFKVRGVWALSFILPDRGRSPTRLLAFYLCGIIRGLNYKPSLLNPGRHKETNCFFFYCPYGASSIWYYELELNGPSWSFLNYTFSRSEIFWNILSNKFRL